MGMQVQGAGGSVAEVGAFAAEPLHTVAKPTDAGSLGHYRFSVVTGTLAAALAANAVVFSCRWSDATRFAVIRYVRTRFMPLTLFTAATLTDATSFDLFIGRSFSAAHTGGTGLTLTGDNLQMRSTMGASLFNDIRIATTAALGGGTVTLDAHPIAQSLRKANRVNPAAATEEAIMPTTDGLNLDIALDAGEHPVVLGQNEGLVLRNRTVWPAAGTGILLVEMAWAEVTAY
jgi:hypothetical protein